MAFLYLPKADVTVNMDYVMRIVTALVPSPSEPQPVEPGIILIMEDRTQIELWGYTQQSFMAIVPKPRP